MSAAGRSSPNPGSPSLYPLLPRWPFLKLGSLGEFFHQQPRNLKAIYFLCALDKNLLWELGKTISKQHPSSNLILAKTFNPSCTRTFQSDSYKIAFDPLEHLRSAPTVFWLESSGPGQQAKGKQAGEGVRKGRCELSSAELWPEGLVNF